MSLYQATSFQALTPKNQQRVLKAYGIFPARTSYFRDPDLDQFLSYIQTVKKTLGYSIDDLWNLYSRWSPIPADLHALTTALSKSWPVVTIEQYPGLIGFAPTNYKENQL